MNHSEAKTHDLKVIAHIRTLFPTKFGIPRQSGLADTRATIVMCPEYRNPDAFRGLEGYSHIWLIWQFSEAVRENWSPTVRPPRLGGNQRMGVFATRSPYRPNAIGLSSVKIEEIDLHTPEGPIITVSGADLMDGTPIYDIKPYLTFTDSHPESVGGFADAVRQDRLHVIYAGDTDLIMPREMTESLTEILRGDPRPSYQNDPERIYGFPYGEFEVQFLVEDNLLTVIRIEKRNQK